MTAPQTLLTTIAARSITLMATGTEPEFREVFDPRAVNRESSKEPPGCRAQGPAAFYESALWLRSAYSDLAFELREVVVSGDLVVADTLMSGRHTGDFVVYDADAKVERAFAPTGRRFAVAQAHFQRIRNGLVVEHWAVRDDLGQATQLGWVPPSPRYLVRCAKATRRAKRAESTPPAISAGG